MIRSAKFWITMAVFQIAFGLTIFAFTRQYYLAGMDGVSAERTAVREPLPIWPQGISAANPPQFDPSIASRTTDPVALSRQADEFFTNKQYGNAADLYEQLLAFAPNNADTYNNLGITLHYLGRSTEALGKLNEGVAADPAHQRIWLTLGFVHSQVGNIEQARVALTNATQMGADQEIAQSAADMLENLP